MSKEKVFIVLSHKHSLRAGTRDQWEVTETVEIVSQLRKKHTTMSSAIGDYINRAMISGSKVGMTDYVGFEAYIRKKYPKQMSELDTAYSKDVVKEESQGVFADEFGNIRTKTVFDV